MFRFFLFIFFWKCLLRLGGFLARLELRREKSVRCLELFIVVLFAFLVLTFVPSNSFRISLGICRRKGGKTREKRGKERKKEEMVQ